MSNVLIIEDDPYISSILKSIFEYENWNVLTAEDGNEGIKLFSENELDLVVTDIVMPDKEGLETIKELREKDGKIPVIAVSGGGKGDPENYLMMARHLGADEVFVKPFNLAELMETVKKLVNL